MVRSFTLRDFPLVRRLSEQGVSLHAESALTDNLHPFWGALLNIVVRAEYPTFVLKSEEQHGSGFIQILIEEDRHHAHILYLSPSIEQLEDNYQGEGSFSKLDVSGEAWLSLLDQAVIEIGQYGIQSLVAEVDENAPELLVLRRAGFAVYARQDIWVHDSVEQDQGVESEAALVLQPKQASDDWDIQLFYANTVPRLVQLVEPDPPLDKGNTWVLRDEKNELVAFVHINEGTIATWLRFFIHPSAEASAGKIVKMALNIVGFTSRRKIYCCVRRYEGWSPAALERTNFKLWGSQAVLVKHTVHHARRKMPSLEMTIENSGLPISTPTIRSYPAIDQNNRIVGTKE
jgi:hypothetical protein